MKQRLLLICTMVVVLVPLLSVFTYSPVNAISEADSTSAEEAAQRSAEKWCSENADPLVQDECVQIFKDGYLGDVGQPKGGFTCTGNQPGNACRGAYAAGQKDRKVDYPEVPGDLCKAYINAAKDSKSAPKELQGLKSSDVGKAINACINGFKIGVHDKSGSCTGKGFEKVACDQGQELGNLHIFASFEAVGHAQGKAISEIGSGSESDSSGGEATVENSCDLNANPLTWVICPVIDGINETVKLLDNIINDLASVGNTDASPNPSRIFCDSNTPEEDKTTCKAYHAAWASFRNLALGFIVIVVLVIVISQAIGSEFLDAYTIRKMLPRVVVAAIGITLSWEIMQFCVAASNAIGFGIKFLIQAPFVQAGFTTTELSGSGSTAVALIGFGAIALISLFGLLSFALTGLIAVLVACLVLILRQMLIIMLAILAPIALIAYVLPNTQRAYKLWSESFIKALLMFPMIVAFISIGRVFSAVATNGSSIGIVGQVIGFAAYFAPYFLIPLTFRFAGGAMSAIGGAVHQRSQGLQQGLSSFRTNQRKQRMANAGERIQTGNAFKRAPTGSIRHRLNRGLQGAALASKAGPNPANWRTNMRTAMNDDSEAGLEKFMSENAGFKIWGNDDAKLHAARFDNREQMAAELIRRDADRFGGEGNRAAREEAISQIERTKRQVNNETFHKARIRQQAKTGTGYQDANGDFDASAMLEDINGVYGGDRNGAGKALGEMRSSLTQSGQVAGVAGYGTWASQLENVFKHNDAATRRTAHMAIMNDAIDSASPSQAIYGKPSSARAMAQAHAHRIQTIARQVNAGNATQEDLSAAVASAAGLYDAMGQAAPGNASEFANVLMGAEVGTPLLDPNGQVRADNGTVRQYVEAQMLENEAFKNRRRDLSQATLAGARAEAAARSRITPGTGGAPTPPSGGPPASPFQR